MKIFIAITTIAVSATVIDPNIPDDPSQNPFAPKRYSQFQAMFRHFFTNDQLMKTYGYGCYCLNLGDRPLAGIMTGVYPVDDKDKHCFEFTRCNRCVTFDYGPDCTPEQIEYDFEISENDEVTCLHPKDTCQRAICECDKANVLGFKGLIDVYDPAYHAFLGFESVRDCQLKPKDPNVAKPKMDCCGEYPDRRPYNQNNDHNNICCDGEITSDNQCVGSSFN